MEKNTQNIKLKKIIKTVFKYSITFIILIIIFNLLLYLGSFFPSSIIEENVRESSEILLEEGNLVPLINGLNIYLDNYTDAVMINTCYSIDNQDPVYSYMAARKNYRRDLTLYSTEDITGELSSYSSNSLDESYDTTRELYNFMEGKVNISVDYARYWHGYLPFLRILLVFFNLYEIRLFLFFLLLIIFGCFIILARKYFGNWISVIFAFSLIAYNYFFLEFSLGQISLFIVMMLANILLLVFKNLSKHIYLFFFVLGAISCYVDLLSVPIITLGVPLLVYLLLERKENIDLNTKNDRKSYIKHSLRIIIISVITWSLGYLFTWLSKWFLFDLLYNKNLISSAILQVLYRSSWDSASLIPLFITTILYFIIDIFMFISTFSICFMMISVALIGKYRFKLKHTSLKNYMCSNFPIFITGLIPIEWFIATINHTSAHSFFVYRLMLISLLSILLCIKDLFIFVKK